MRLIDIAMNNLRRKNGLAIEHRGMGLRQVVKLIKAGEHIGIPADQEARWHGILVPFFGRESLTHPGGAFLSLKTGAALVPSFHIRQGRRHLIRYLPPIFPEGSEVTDEALASLTAENCCRLEEMIRLYPDHWFWLHKRWKRAPRGADGLPRRAGSAADDSEAASDSSAAGGDAEGRRAPA